MEMKSQIAKAVHGFWFYKNNSSIAGLSGIPTLLMVLKRWKKRGGEYASPDVDLIDL